MRLICLLAVVAAYASVSPARAAEIVRLGKENWSLAPGGKEADAIYGDYLLRNDRIAAVVADTVEGRHAHMNCRNVQGAVIDLAIRGPEGRAGNDQFTAFKPHGEFTRDPAATRAEILPASQGEVRLRVTRPATEADPVENVTEYALRDGEPFLRVTTRHRNTTARSVERRLSDKIRCDQTFLQTPEGAFPSVSFYDRWFRAGYGVARPGGRIETNGRWGGMGGANGGTWLDFPELVTNATTRAFLLGPGAEVVLTRYLIAGSDMAGVQRAAGAALNQSACALEVAVTDAERRPVEAAEILLRQGTVVASAAITDARGRAEFHLPPAAYTVAISQQGRLTKDAPLTLSGSQELAVTLGARSQVEFSVTDGQGKGIPCKVQFIGIEGTPTPDLGPEQRAHGCKNLHFSPKGDFSVPLPPGRYYLILSRGPEYDAAYRYLNLAEGQTARVTARLPRVVETRGWVSADFHNHSSESGDNTTEPESRITCLVAEGLEFCPSTEHNRVQTYRHRLKALGLERLMATSDGIELTGIPLLLNHQNAFPLRHQPGTQDGGAPRTDPDPRTQIKRLRDHDGGAEKLVQQNHPDIGWLIYDKDGDGRPDEGFGTMEFTHVIEIWATGILAMQPTTGAGENLRNNRIFNWLQLLNQGHRLPGVANTDAHYCYHQSGVIRNYVRSSTDDPAAIDELEMVRAARQGRMVMTNGPFLEVSLNGAGPGEEVRRRRGSLRVRVQCANWLDVDRVQVLVNGRPDPALNFTRARHAGSFHDGVVKFEREISINLERDAHLIVVAIGEQHSTGPVMGPRADPPLAISNPIYVDADGGGFQANKDTLGAPLPTRKAP